METISKARIIPIEEQQKIIDGILCGDIDSESIMVIDNEDFECWGLDDCTVDHIVNQWKCSHRYIWIQRPTISQF